jgi:hypothetical protein
MQVSVTRFSENKNGEQIEIKYGSSEDVTE